LPHETGCRAEDRQGSAGVAGAGTRGPARAGQVGMGKGCRHAVVSLKLPEGLRPSYAERKRLPASRSDISGNGIRFLQEIVCPFADGYDLCPEGRTAATREIAKRR